MQPLSAKASPFQRFAHFSARASGHSTAFGLALGLIAGWVVTGPLFQFSDTWQLVINTSTTIVTFLMVFLIQNSQNRDCEALQLKLDELIRANREAHNALLDIEELSEDELDQIKLGYERLAHHARRDLRSGKSDLGLSEVDRQSIQHGEKKGNNRPGARRPA
jgi:low affinity Fe/Cu permease